MDRERKAFEEWAGSAEGRLAREWAHDPVPLDEALTLFARQAWKARAALSRASGEATEAMVEAGARAAATFVVNQLRGCIAVGSLKTILEKDPAVLIEQAVAAAMRAESEGGGVCRSSALGGCQPGDRGHVSAAPPSPGSDLPREVHAFLRAIGGSEYIDTKDAATARELADELRALYQIPPAQEGGDDA